MDPVGIRVSLQFQGIGKVSHNQSNRGCEDEVNKGEYNSRLEISYFLCDYLPSLPEFLKHL